MPRLFTGLEIPSDLAMDLGMMRGGISGARWIDVENYHLTLRFHRRHRRRHCARCPLIS